MWVWDENDEWAQVLPKSANKTRIKCHIHPPDEVSKGASQEVQPGWSQGDENSYATNNQQQVVCIQNKLKILRLKTN